MDHRPYAVGASETFFIDGNHWPAAYESSDASVLRVESVRDGQARVQFLRTGVATLSARSLGDSSLIAETVLRVLDTDRVEWTAGASLLAVPPNELPLPKVVVGGSVPFHVVLYAGAEELQGAHLLRVEHGPGRVQYGARTKSDWLIVSATEPGPIAVTYAVEGVSRTFSVEAVAASEVVRLELVSERHGLHGRANVFAHAYLADGTPALGAPVEWLFPGGAPEGTGEVSLYELDESRSATLTARVDGVVATIPIHPARHSQQAVITGDQLACSAAGHGAAGLSMLAWSVLALSVVRRRRKSS